MTGYNKGQMPDTDFRYEEFEGLLGRFATSLSPLRNSENPEDLKDYQKAIGALDRFAQRYHVRSPKEVMENARGMSNFSLIDMMDSFWKDFALLDNPKRPENNADWAELGRAILSVFARYEIATAEYFEVEGRQVPVKLKKLAEDCKHKTLADVLTANC